MYAERIRGLRDPFLETFNQPGPDKPCELREMSTVAPQALTLFNSQEVLDRAVAFANRLVEEELPSEEATICRAFQLAFGRQPNDRELTSCAAHWRQATAEEETKTYGRTEFRDRLTRTVMAEKTGQPYSFEEVMPAYTNYQPDLQIADIDATTRGLAHVCLVWFNTNEFLYLD
jgi:hypothetical protein